MMNPTLTALRAQGLLGVHSACLYMVWTRVCGLITSFGQKQFNRTVNIKDLYAKPFVGRTSWYIHLIFVCVLWQSLNKLIGVTIQACNLWLLFGVLTCIWLFDVQTQCSWAKWALTSLQPQAHHSTSLNGLFQKELNPVLDFCGFRGASTLLSFKRGTEPQQKRQPPCNRPTSLCNMPKISL